MSHRKRNYQTMLTINPDYRSGDPTQPPIKKVVVSSSQDPKVRDLIQGVVDPAERVDMFLESEVFIELLMHPATRGDTLSALWGEVSRGDWDDVDELFEDDQGGSFANGIAILKGDYSIRLARVVTKPTASKEGNPARAESFLILDAPEIKRTWVIAPEDSSLTRKFGKDFSKEIESQGDKSVKAHLRIVADAFAISKELDTYLSSSQRDMLNNAAYTLWISQCYKDLDIEGVSGDPDPSSFEEACNQIVLTKIKSFRTRFVLKSKAKVEDALEM